VFPHQLPAAVALLDLVDPGRAPTFAEQVAPLGVVQLFGPGAAGQGLGHLALADAEGLGNRILAVLIQPGAGAFAEPVAPSDVGLLFWGDLDVFDHYVSSSSHSTGSGPRAR